MAPRSEPEWVKKLTPSGPQGSELLAMERAKSNINIDKLSNFILGKDFLARQQRILKLLEAEPVFDKSGNYTMGRLEKFPVGLARGKKIRELQVKHNWTFEDQKMADSLISEPTPYGLHASMFLVCGFTSCIR